MAELKLLLLASFLLVMIGCGRDHPTQRIGPIKVAAAIHCPHCGEALPTLVGDEGANKLVAYEIASDNSIELRQELHCGACGKDFHFTVDLVKWRCPVCNAVLNQPDAACTICPQLKLVEKLASLCDGVPFAEAAAYDPARPGLHPLVLLNAEKISDFLGHKTPWTLELPQDWWPQKASDVELVALFQHHSETIDSESYSDAGQSATVVRQRSRYVVRILAAKTGQLLSTKEFVGGEPGPFPSTVTFEIPTHRYLGPSAINGKLPDFEEVRSWLASFVDSTAGRE